MKALRVDCYLTKGMQEKKGGCLVSAPENVTECKQLLRRLMAEVISDIELSLSTGVWDCGLYLEIVQVPEALDGFYKWQDALAKLPGVTLFHWEGQTNGKK